MTWTSCRLGDVLTLARGFDLPASKRKDGEIPIVSSSGVTGYHCEFKLRGPGVVTGRYGTIGDVYFIEGDYWPLNTALYVSDFKGCSPRFASYFLRNILSGYQSDKAAVPGVNRNVLHELRVKKPDREVQERIADILSSYDDLLENNIRRITLLEDAACQLYREWFVRLRFPGHEHTLVVDGMPQGWQRTPLEQILTLQRGFDLPVQKRELGDVPIVASTGVVGYHNRSKVHGPGIVTGRSGTLGEVQYVSQDFWPLNTALWVKEFKRATPLFALFLLRQMNLKQFNGGASVPTLDRKTLHKVEVLLPPVTLMGAFDECAKPLFEQSRVLTEQNAKLRAARDLLLPRLMSGEIPV